MRRTILLLPFFLAGPASAADAVGEWLVADKTATIRVTPCGEALCGIIASTKEPATTDVKNPDPAKRSRPIVGLQILEDYRPIGPDRWEGYAYNSKDGTTHKTRLIAKKDVLRIEGCVLGGLLCGGEDWTRVPEAPAETRANGEPRPAASSAAARASGDARSSAVARANAAEARPSGDTRSATPATEARGGKDSRPASSPAEARPKKEPRPAVEARANGDLRPVAPAAEGRAIGDPSQATPAAEARKAMK